MATLKRSQLHRIYEDALALQQAGDVLDGKSLEKKFGVTVFGASCLMFMLEQQAYYPDLEKIYHHKQAPLASNKDLEQVEFIQFLEDVPPFSKFQLVDEELSPHDKSLYVSLGFARRRSPEEFRRDMINLYVNLCQATDQYRADFREAIARRDVEFVKKQFQGKNLEKVKRQLKKMKFTLQEIEAAFKIWNFEN